MANVRLLASGTDELKKIAERMKELAEQLGEEFGKIYRIIEGELANAWEGDDQKAFSYQVNGCKQYFEQLKDLMQKYSEMLRRVAESYDDQQSDIRDAVKKIVF